MRIGHGSWSLVELDAEPSRAAKLSKAAGEGDPPRASCVAGAIREGHNRYAIVAELHDRIELVSHALQAAEGRLGDTARTMERSVNPSDNQVHVALCPTSPTSQQAIRLMNYLLLH